MTPKKSATASATVHRARPWPGKRTSKRPGTAGRPQLANCASMLHLACPRGAAPRAGAQMICVEQRQMPASATESPKEEHATTTWARHVPGEAPGSRLWLDYRLRYIPNTSSTAVVVSTSLPWSTCTRYVVAVCHYASSFHRRRPRLRWESIWSRHLEINSMFAQFQSTFTRHESSFQGRLVRPLEGFRRQFCPCDPRNARKSTKVGVWGLNRCETCSHRTDLDESHSKRHGATRRSSPRHSWASSLTIVSSSNSAVWVSPQHWEVLHL